ncbi:hypothetical protein [Pseudoalteromonas aurantia]|uniref:Uncharacterized protein n=1 Tax=Pseudoalteromonas aurantia TaxID=43654 RepID=A0ABY2VX51_9GAMM|nr:hypothetical protein [Pseudoalteromonas aurantia]TMO66475.1 hypothetical protein CWC18_03385 [Pseudoalteromonas aurantia]TMO74195.1 hypothetical protein CWC20_11055 [Pseudoalteromonas aurantia]
MNKFSLHHVFSSMNLFIKANGKHKEIARSDCSLVSDGYLAIKPPRVKTVKNNLTSSKTENAICELSTKVCTLALGGTAYKTPRAVATNFAPVPPIVKDDKKQG